METETSNNRKEGSPKNKSEEKSDKKSDIETKNKLLTTQDKKQKESDNSNIHENEDLFIFYDQCDLLNMIAIPTFGKYSPEYTLFEQVLILKRKSKFENIPDFIKKKLDYLEKKHPNVIPEYFHITLGNLLVKASNEEELNDTFEYLNLLSHPYVFNNCTLEQEPCTNIYCAAFTDEYEMDTIKQTDGIDLLRINPECELDDEQLIREILIHKSSDGYPSLSPNNCAILINLNAQIINFYLIVCGTYEGQIVKCFVGNYVIIPNVNNSILFGEFYNKMVIASKKKDLTKELFILKYKFKDYMNYIFNFGISEILKVNDMKSFKLCIMKIFSYIFDFSSVDDDDNSKKIHEKELMNMQSFYYNNFLNFVGDLYEFSSLIDPNFGEKFVQSCLSNKYIEELLVKYRDYNLARFNNIISKYLFFIYENVNDLDDIEEKIKETYKKDILPNLKQFFCDILNTDEDSLDKIKNNYCEEKRKRKDNPNIEILINICKAIRNGEDFIDDMNQLDEIVREYLFYIVWDYKGKPMKIHNDFGRVSFMNTEIDGKYYCNKEEQINCCQKIIQILEKADKHNFNPRPE